MRFWDSSALVSFLLNEPTSPRMHSLLQRDAQVAVWWTTDVECWAGVCRAHRAGRISAETQDRAAKALAELRAAWLEIEPVEEVRRHARRLLGIHKLRAADALQLGAALVWRGRSAPAEFVALDAPLREAARLEGFALTTL